MTQRSRLATIGRATLPSRNIERLAAADDQNKSSKLEVWSMPGEKVIALKPVFNFEIEKKTKKISCDSFRSSDLRVMSPARFRCATQLIVSC